MHVRTYDRLLELLLKDPYSIEIPSLARKLEEYSDFKCSKDIELLKGVWELKWSSSKIPFLKYSSFYENLQILDPFTLKGMNLLKPKNLNYIIGTSILIDIKIINDIRIQADFTNAGIIGPKFLSKKIKILKKFKKPQRGFLDITYLRDDIRICRGDKGTLFVLLRYKNEHLFNEFIECYEKFKI